MSDDGGKAYMRTSGLWTELGEAMARAMEADGWVFGEDGIPRRREEPLFLERIGSHISDAPKKS